MIVASIGGELFALDNLADANTLLEILSRAKAIDDGYINKDYERAYFELPAGSRRRDVEIKVVRAELLTQDRYAALRNENGVTA